MKLNSSKQLAKSEGLFLFVLKIALKPRMIFTFLKACLKNIFSPYRDCLGQQNPKCLLGGSVQKESANPSALSTAQTFLIFVFGGSTDMD